MTQRKPVSVSYQIDSPATTSGKFIGVISPSVDNVIGAATYEIAGDLPPGVTLDSATGIITGTPTSNGIFDGLTVTATDSEGADYAGTYGPFDIGVSLRGNVGLPSTTYVTVRAGEPFTKTLNVTNVTRPLSFEPKDGVMPFGLDLDTETGTVSGTLPDAGVFSAGVTASDAFGRAKTTNVKITSVGAISISQPTKLSFSQYEAVSTKAVSTNAIGASTYELAAGTLPSGVSLDTTNGFFSGKAEDKGTFSGIVVKVTDSTGSSAQTDPFNIVVGDRVDLVMNTDASYDVYANRNFKLTLPVKNAVGAVTYAMTGTLPPGLSFNSEKGTFSGKATDVGTYSNINVTATDSVGGTVSKTLAFKVATNGKAIALNLTAFETKVGHPIATEAPTWSNTVGDVTLWADETLSEHGLTIDPSTGVVTGQATEVMYIAPNVNITDSSERVTSKPLSISVIPNIVVNVADTVDAVVSKALPTVSVTADNSIGTTVWSYSGTPPEGVNISKSAAYVRLTGTPREMGTFPITVTVTDGLGDTATKTFDFVVVSNGVAPSATVSPSKTGYYVNSSANLTFSDSGFRVGDTISLAPGSAPLPPGMTITSTAYDNWRLTKASGLGDSVKGVYQGIVFRVMGTDGLYTDTSPVTIIYRPTGTLDFADQTFETRAGVPVSMAAPTPRTGLPIQDLKFEFSRDVTGGQLKIDERTGENSGTTTVTGSNTVKVSEYYDDTVIRSFTYSVKFTVLPLSVTMDDISVFEGAEYTSRVPALINGRPEGRFTLSGDIPQGLSVNPTNGVLSGNTSDIGVHMVTLTYTDDYDSVDVPVSISVIAPDDAGHRFWKLYAYNNGYWYTTRVYETVFRDANGGNVMASAAISGGSPEAYDNDDTTFMGITTSKAQTLVLEFAHPIAIKSATTHGKGSASTALNLQYFWSDDGETWTQVGDDKRIGSNVEATVTTTF